MGQLTLGSGGGSVGKFADDVLIEDGLTWKVTIPSTLKAGNYVLRHELIALHEGGTEGKTQMYPQCINLQVTGSGTASPPAGVVGTALYKSTDAGILHNIYNDEALSSPSDYQIPGPALVALGSSAGNSNSNGNAAVSSASSTTAAAAATTASSAVSQATATTASTVVVATSSATAKATATATTKATAAATTSKASAVQTAQPASNSPATTRPKKTCNGRRRRHARQIKNVM